MLSLLQRLPHPNGSGDDVVYAGSVVSITEHEGAVSLTLTLDEHYRTLKRIIPPHLSSLPWLTSLSITLATPSPSSPHPTTPSTLSPTPPTHPSPSPSPSPSSRPPSPSPSSSTSLPPNLRSIRRILAISSCKGGVGKSTVAVNLAYALSRLGLRVGLFDADLYGPSLPTLVNRGEWAGVGLPLTPGPNPTLTPFTYRGVKTMSYGYASPPPATSSSSTPSSPSSPSSPSPPSPSPSPSPNIMRGPIASTLTRDLLTRTAWGPLDYLLLDCPPGTSDILLTLTQTLPLTAALIVTTPQRLAYVDVVRGVEMFRRVRVPVVGVVENMSEVVCGGCGGRHRVFGEGHMKEMKAEVERGGGGWGGGGGLGGVGRSEGAGGGVLEYRIPLVAEVSEWSDRGDPFVLRTEGGEGAAEVRAVYERMAREVHERVEGVGSGRREVKVRWEEAKQEGQEGMVVMEQGEGGGGGGGGGGSVGYVEGWVLRGECRCAGCVDEVTGKRKEVGRVRKGVRVVGMQERGNYAVAVAWSDGHASSLYTHEHIAQLTRPTKAEAHLHAQRIAAQPPPQLQPFA